MRSEDSNIESILDKAISEIRDQQADPAAIDSAAARVWERISLEQTADHQTHRVEKIRGCEDFRALIPAYRAHELAEARALLLKDHLHECVGCRKAFEAASGKVAAFVPASRKRFAWSASPAMRWAVAACLTVAAGLTSWGVFDYYNSTPVGSRVAVQTVDGALYQLTDAGGIAVQAGAELPAGARIRTAKDSGAILRLRDGSLVEMRERSDLSVSETRRDLTLRLERGSVIVEAAEQGSGHLYVVTRDCKVAVTGTVFSVNSGAKGSRVAVIEGEVRVAQDGKQSVLRPGDQVATSASMAPVSVSDEIAWSQKVDQHLALLGEFSVLQKKLEDVRFPELRYSSRLLNRMPANTAIYASIPNLGPMISDAHRIFSQRVQESPVLREWWQAQMEGGNRGLKLDELITEFRAFSDYLGDEIVLAAAADADGKVESPVLVAELRRNGFKEFAEAEFRKLSGGQTNDEVQIVESLAAIQTARRGLVVLVRPDVVAVSPDAGALRIVAGALESQGAGGFAGTPLHARIESVYRAGAGLLFTADIERLAGPAKAGNERGDELGLNDLKYVVVEQKEAGSTTDTRAEVTFKGVRTGVAAWVAAPAVIGALDFFSPEASLVSAFAIKNPAALLDEFLLNRPGAQRDAASLEAKLGLNIRDDLAAPLGAEFAFALDGPALPVPSWKLALEVYDPARLQASIQKIVQSGNVELAAQGKPAVQMTQETVAGRTWHALTNPAGQPFTEVHYSYVDGYLVAAPNRALVERAIQYRATGYTLPRSAAFRALLPRDSFANFSGMVYHNLGSTLGGAVQTLGGAAPLTDEQRKAVEGFAADLKPTLVTIYGQPDRITLASSGSFFGLNARNFVGLQGPMGIAQMFGARKPGTRKDAPAYRK